ncbi:class I histocompatibility antigen, Gogo-C*0203 alpha chain-like [Sinocyclocheilus grahami]|uniref:class I histocompatibility antigen, Gogo-C*0203 alpha chain-like n=1 Tax=Sinocyclocheilus grahami TaxID=75366 RepID=UPI0007ACBD20|nr:PREDICTED: class I histocompatibility antigen, Gogo-C*0203 alpha chain-like [Sinocyclocheilus grahami]
MLLFFVTFAFLVDLSWALPTDVIIQFERSVLVNGTVVERILVNDAHLKGQFDKQPVVRPIQDEVLKMMVENDHHVTASYGTYIRLRECKLRGYRVLQLSDRFQLNGKDYLTLDSDTDSWTVLMPEAQDLKQSWTLKAEQASLEKIHLKEECEEFIKRRNDTQNQEGVLGSIIHYPAHHLEVPLDGQSQKNISSPC